MIIKYSARRILYDTEYDNKLFLSMRRETVVPVLKYFGAKIGNNTKIDTPLIIHYKNVDLSNLEIGVDCNISKNCFFDLAGSIKIKDNCTLAMNVSLITHIDFGHSHPIHKGANEIGGITIAEGTYIGANTVILKGVKIGAHILIGACSLVNRNLDEQGIYLGTPIKKIK